MTSTTRSWSRMRRSEACVVIGKSQTFADRVDARATAFETHLLYTSAPVPNKDKLQDQ